MAIDAFYRTFDVAVIDEFGNRSALPNSDIEFYNVTQEITIDTIATDDEGRIDAGGFDSGTDDAAAGDTVELRSDGSRVVQFRLSPTAEAAVLDPDAVVTYIAEDLSTEYEVPENAQAFLFDTAQPDKKPVFLGDAKIDGGVVRFPHRPNTAQNAEIFINPKASTVKAEFGDKSQRLSYPLSIPSLGLVLLTTFEIDLSTTSDQTIYTVPAGFRMIPTFLVLRDSTIELLADMPGETITFEHEATTQIALLDCDDYGLGTTYKAIYITGNPPIFVAGEDLTAKASDAPGGSIKIDVFGYLLPVPAAPDPIALLAFDAHSGNNTTTTTDPINTTGADLLIIGGAYHNPAGAPTESDSESNGYTDLTASAGGNGSARMHYKTNPVTDAAHTATYALSGSYNSILFAAFSNVLDAAPEAETGAGNASATTIQPGSITPSEDNCVLITVCEYVAASGVPTINSGFTVIGYINHASNYSVAMAMKVQTTAGAENPTWTAPGSADRIASRMACFKHA